VYIDPNFEANKHKNVYQRFQTKSSWNKSVSIFETFLRFCTNYPTPCWS